MSALLPLSLAACLQTQGDFGRPRSGFTNDSLLPFIGKTAAHVRGEAVSAYSLTENEKELRQRSYAFLMPEKEAPYSVYQAGYFEFHRLLPPRQPDKTLYHRTLMGGPFMGQSIGSSPNMRRLTQGNDSFRSLSSRYHRLNDAILGDQELIPAFQQIAGEVLRVDEIRIRAVAQVADVSAEQRESAYARVCENHEIIARVNWAFYDRAAQYRYALEHLLLEGPEPAAIAAEHNLIVFEKNLNRFAAYPNNSAFCPSRTEAPAPLTAHKTNPINKPSFRKRRV